MYSLKGGGDVRQTKERRGKTFGGKKEIIKTKFANGERPGKSWPTESRVPKRGEGIWGVSKTRTGRSHVDSYVLGM